MSIGNKKENAWWRSKYVLWFFISLPGLLLSVALLNAQLDYENLMHATGEFSARFLVFSLIATPLVMLFPRFTFPRWLNRNKRYFGVAAFGYALYHTVVYLVEEPASEVVKGFFEFSLLTAWIAFIIWVPMAITSTDGWVKRLKGNWKKLHNWGYLAAVLAFLHWAFIHYHWQPALVHATPVLLLQGYRWIKVVLKEK